VWSQFAEWKALPAKRSRPGMSGVLGMCNIPLPNTSARARTGSAPVFVYTLHKPVLSSKLARSTFVPYRMCDETRNFSAQWRRYSWISACGAQMRDQIRLGSKD
jgi:hypothetical protein